MAELSLIKTNYSVEIGISPKIADMAIVPINLDGTRSILDTYILKQYGYSASRLPDISQLMYGFAVLSQPDKKTIFFVVMDNTKDVTNNLRNNLFNVLSEFRGWFHSKKLWIPLIGTENGLTVEDSYEIIVDTYNKFQDKYPSDVLLYLSLPDSTSGKSLFNKLRGFSNVSSKNITNKCYSVGAYWDGIDQLNRFIKENIWEKGYTDNSYSDIINKINTNDLIIIKSTFRKAGLSYLRVKAIGLVRFNPKNGAKLYVDWRHENLSIDIENLGYLRHTIQELSPNEIIRISEQCKELKDELAFTTNKVKIPGIISDSDKGEDYLSISNDIDAFAKVITAQSFEPPLSIALFGKWGSGKSFFMNKLRDKIDALSNSANDVYCKGIAHIHFNAWSYVDSNLWASLVTRIFDGLNIYINANADTNEKKIIEKKLQEKLAITKEEHSRLENQKNSIEKQIQTLVTKRESVETKLNTAVEKIRNKTLLSSIEVINSEFKVKEKIEDAINANHDIKLLVEQLPEEYRNNPEKFYETISSKTTFLKQFFKKNQILCNVIWLILIISLVAFTPLLIRLFTDRLSNLHFIIPQIVLSSIVTFRAILKRAESVQKSLSPFISATWKIKEEYKKSIAKATEEFEQQEIEKNKSELLLLSDHIHKSESLKSEIEYKIENALASEALYSFIERRSKSSDYQKHLGLISTIRKDFEVLSELFTEHRNETLNNQHDEQFRSLFTKPLDRIVLYIDDLDRCSEENVVEVLEAVNLLMAFPLFVVIVGVDPRWVRNALLKKYDWQFGIEKSDRNKQIENIEVSNYLEKIFQIPFRLKDADGYNVKNMIKSLASTSTQLYSDERISIVESSIIEKNEEIEDEEIVDELNSHIAEIHNVSNINYEALTLSDSEIQIMQNLSEIIGNNPRAVKRFVNIYRIIKAHKDFEVVGDEEYDDKLSLLFLLAISIGNFKSLQKEIHEFIQKHNSERSCNFEEFFKPTINTKIELMSLKSILEKDSVKNILTISTESLYRHVLLINRFTF